MLNNFRSALLAKEDKFNSLAQFNGGADINLSFSNDVVAWTKSPDSPNILSGIRVLSEQSFSNMGCFIYKDTINLNIKNLASYAILVDSNSSYWLAFIEAAHDEKAKIKQIKISQLSSDWRAYFKRIQYLGGECADILSKL